MELIIKNKVITTPISTILSTLKREINGKYLDYIGPEKDNDITITCPWHKDGHERRPSCHVFTRRDDPKIYYGTCHCFTCGKQLPLYSLVGHCLDGDDALGKEWLIERFGNVFYETEEILPEIILEKPDKHYLDNSILGKYVDNFTYLKSRGISEEIQRKFCIKYDPVNQSVVFPVWDEHGKLVMLTERSTTGKKFNISKGKEKPIYLLNYVLKYKFNTVIVVEGQVDSLKAWTNGYPSVALFGAGTTKHQIDILNKSGIYHFILMYDNDAAGRHGADKFKKLISNDRLITDIIMPPFKDVGDCSKNELEELLIKNNVFNCFK